MQGKSPLGGRDEDRNFLHTVPPYIAYSLPPSTMSFNLTLLAACDLQGEIKMGPLRWNPNLMRRGQRIHCKWPIGVGPTPPILVYIIIGHLIGTWLRTRIAESCVSRTIYKGKASKNVARQERHLPIDFCMETGRMYWRSQGALPNGPFVWRLTFFVPGSSKVMMRITAGK